jgi:hypothetical protein
MLAKRVLSNQFTKNSMNNQPKTNLNRLSGTTAKKEPKSKVATPVQTIIDLSSPQQEQA